jgi:rod shape-determining protein MreD
MFDRVDIPLGRTVAAVIPFTCALIGLILSNFPVVFLPSELKTPMLSLMPIYFWCLVRPDLMPPSAVFVIGVLEDFFSGSPPGVWTLSYVATYALVDRERDAFAGLSGVAAILGFGGAMLVTTVVAWLVDAFYRGGLPPLAPLSMQFAMSILFYVPVAMLLGVVHRRLVGPLRSDF